MGSRVRRPSWWARRGSRRRPVSRVYTIATTIVRSMPGPPFGVGRYLSRAGHRRHRLSSCRPMSSTASSSRTFPSSRAPERLGAHRRLVRGVGRLLARVSGRHRLPGATRSPRGSWPAGGSLSNPVGTTGRWRSRELRSRVGGEAGGVKLYRPVARRTQSEDPDRHPHPTGSAVSVTAFGAMRASIHPIGSVVSITVSCN